MVTLSINKLGDCKFEVVINAAGVITTRQMTVRDDLSILEQIEVLLKSHSGARSVVLG